MAAENPDTPRGASHESAAEACAQAVATTEAPSPVFTAKAAIWADFRAGLISLQEAERRSAKIGAASAEAETSRQRKGAHPPAPRPRHKRPAPKPSRQYANPMATTAMRDDRLTPGAKALLVVLRARCGKGRVTAFAKATLAATMQRSARTIRRYLLDLERFGYIAARIRKTARGFHTGLVVTLTDKVLPFFAEQKELAAWLTEAPDRERIPFAPFAAMGRAAIAMDLPMPTLAIKTRRNPIFQGVTVLSPNNHIHQDSSFRERFRREISGGFWGKGGGST
ncbi:helix-turn-helix domain-containing protein [Jiella avicenniae]|uniref:Helix-turn-helix domain-containing protein n=1 Tax=Jiella avicenniae TaxID=2907202 RepID=A0A9X1P795_9HYPH|nr:helix-turn-helix domain-containing protein [Jiella avicenniae]MCE7030573.1 helix-turn-helix domain-containing protein [Jiella avicenniae]